MKLYQEKYADMTTVGASNLMTMNIPVRNNHHGLLLNCISAVPAALTQAQIETDVSWVSITLTHKGRQVKILDRMTPAEIFDLLNDYPDAGKAAYTNAGVLYIPFSLPGRFRAMNWALSLGMLDVDVYNVQVQLAAGLATLATMEVVPEIDLEPMRPLGEYVQWVLHTRDRAATGEEQVLDAPQGEEGTAMFEYHIGLGTAPGVISNVDVELDKNHIYTDLDAAMNNFNLHRRGKTPNASYFHVPFDLDHDVIYVGRAKSFVQRWTWSTAPVTYRVIYGMVAGMQPSNPNVNVAPAGVNPGKAA